MTVETEVVQTTLDLDQLLQEREKVAAYLRITEEMGPSAQLIAFINYDNQLSEELGLESFETMDLEMQHLTLSMHLDLDSLDTMAMEGLADSLKKYRKWLVGGGLLGLATGMLGPLGIAMVVSGVIGTVLNNETKVSSTKHFTAMSTVFEAALRNEIAFTNHIPTTLDEKAWEEFATKYTKDVHEKEIKRIDKDTPGVMKLVDFKDSGWTVDSFKNAVAWMVKAAKRVDEAEKKQSDRLDKIEKLLENGGKVEGKTLKYISQSIKSSSKEYHHSAYLLHEVKDMLAGVAHHFEEKKKD